jgi:hypothetical protein
VADENRMSGMQTILRLDRDAGGANESIQLNGRANCESPEWRGVTGAATRKAWKRFDEVPRRNEAKADNRHGKIWDSSKAALHHAVG